MTDSLGIISIQGPKSREILARMVKDQGLESLAYSKSKELILLCNDGQERPVTALRMSYVGELGYELHAKVEDCEAIFDSLQSLDNDLGLAGFEALGTMSLEKGYRHWHGDIEATDTPAEAGMMFACKKSKDFLGKLRVNDKATKRLVTLTASPEVPLNGNEVIYRNGELVGFLRRGSFGYTLNKAIGTGYVDFKGKPEGQSIKEFLTMANYELDVMGEKFEASVSLTPLYDPQRTKLEVEV